VFSTAADGTGQAQRLIASDGQPGACSWSADGQTLVVAEARVGANTDIGLVSIERPDDPIEWVLDGDSDETQPAVSPDGRWMADVDNASGQEEVFVTPFPNVGDDRWQISRDGGFAPVWGPDSSELFYQTVAPENVISIMAAVNDTEPTFIPGNPVPLFEGPYRSGAAQFPHVFDVSPDGDRFLMIKEPAATPRSNNIVLVQNFDEELKRLVPTN
jgi:hypothetical protein